MRNVCFVSVMVLIVLVLTSCSLYPLKSTTSTAGNQKPRLMCFGDSITVGIGDDNGFGYRDHLQDALCMEASFVGPYDSPALDEHYATQHAGQSGQRVAHMSERLAAHLVEYLPLPNPPGSAVLIHAGTNDILRGGSCEDAVNSLRQIITTIDEYDPTLDIYVSRIIPLRYGRDEVDTFNDFITALVRRNPKKNLFLVDHCKAFLDEPDWRRTLMSNDEHPNDKGYKRMAETWAAAINQRWHLLIDGKGSEESL